MNYIKQMRKMIGNETLFTAGCGIILENEGKILLQHRADEDCWGIPGGVMEMGETFEGTALRELNEETGLTASALQLFGIYSGDSCFVQYPNGDKMYSVQIIFHAKEYTGSLQQEGSEAREHKFFRPTELPDNLNPRQRSFIVQWAEGKATPVIE
ncbi:NUDIX hydrolase [Falsibacillus albus]|uniref:NUDIX hydrolase n=1 Tax=Falsibacillus albus TaxID=2478915 RepID=UPI001F1865A3|nr:NUDIX hydrolase [Falsibacillus albus]